MLPAKTDGGDYSLMNEPFMTFFLTLILIPALGFYLSNLIKGKDKLQTDLWNQWQEGARERNQSILDRIDKIDSCLHNIKTDMKGKVDHHVCEKNHDNVRAEVDRLRNRVANGI